MTHLDALLGTLLLRNNCVVIPAFGGFVANHISAKVDVKNGLITPPSKALSFNKNLNNNDGLIINHLANEKKISFDVAQSIISLEVQQIKAQLNDGKRIHFHNVGFLYTNTAGKIAFEQDRFFNLLLSSYGLGNVQFISEEEEIEAVIQTPRAVNTQKELAFDTPNIVLDKEEVETAKTEETKEIEHPAVAKKSSGGILLKIVKYAAVAALVPLAFYSFWIPMKTDVLKSGIIYKDDFNPFKSSEDIKYQATVKKEVLTIDSVQPLATLSSITDNLNSAAPVFAYPLDEDLFIPVWRKKQEVNSIENSEVNEVVTAKNSYHAIVGCFGDPTNASDLISDLKSKGFNAYEVDVRGGLHRISAGNTTNRSEISSLREKLASTNLNVWILKK
ncbi:HU domain-containing protein [Brumimicrobium mesophilum]|uniref:HU domain-containing protein n=1 Tax=Brumimicrobium mesophilum TaxID=392717 RepID=UPI000D140545|nr:SPOR domain-containing protein [Brumimicrobium mesophilum]